MPARAAKLLNGIVSTWPWSEKKTGTWLQRLLGQLPAWPTASLTPHIKSEVDSASPATFERELHQKKFPSIVMTIADIGNTFCLCCRGHSRVQLRMYSLLDSVLASQFAESPIFFHTDKLERIDSGSMNPAGLDWTLSSYSTKDEYAWSLIVHANVLYEC
jgi:hypothetical protein